jgi:hypothetical protein
MKLTKLRVKRIKASEKFSQEDMRYLQKKISGRSVYKNLSSLYYRRPKNNKVWFQY